MAGKGLNSRCKKENTGSDSKEGGFYCWKYWRGDWDFIQADNLVSGDGLNSWVRSQHNVWPAKSWTRDVSWWADTSGSGLSCQTGHQSCYVSRHACNTVPQSLYYDCNPAIKSYSHSMSSQLANEWESTCSLCVDFKPQSWTLAKADTWLLPPLVYCDGVYLVLHPTQSHLLISWILLTHKVKGSSSFSVLNIKLWQYNRRVAKQTVGLALSKG